MSTRIMYRVSYVDWAKSLDWQTTPLFESPITAEHLKDEFKAQGYLAIVDEVATETR